MKWCEACLCEYPDEEVFPLKQLGDNLICIPCEHQFREAYKDLLIRFSNGNNGK